MTAQEVLISGKSSFKLEVPYRLIQSGGREKQPLYLYFHENGMDLERLEEQTRIMHKLPGYHLLLQAPYPDVRKKVGTRGFYWIPQYDDKQVITAAREHVSEFLQEVIDGVLPHIEVSRLVLVGWKGSRSQVSYFCATRPHYVNEVIMLGTTMNHDWMDKDRKRYQHIRVLGLSGKDSEINDDLVRTVSRWIGLP